MSIISKHPQQTGETRYTAYAFLELYSKCSTMYPGSQGCKFLQATMKIFSFNYASHGGTEGEILTRKVKNTTVIK